MGLRECHVVCEHVISGEQRKRGELRAAGMRGGVTLCQRQGCADIRNVQLSGGGGGQGHPGQREPQKQTAQRPRDVREGRGCSMQDDEKVANGGGKEGLFKERVGRPGRVAPLVGAPSQTPKGCGFHPWTGHMPRLQV